jgi:hypothetical protein
MDRFLIKRTVPPSESPSVDKVGASLEKMQTTDGGPSSKKARVSVSVQKYIEDEAEVDLQEGEEEDADGDGEDSSLGSFIAPDEEEEEEGETDDESGDVGRATEFVGWERRELGHLIERLQKLKERLEQRESEYQDLIRQQTLSPTHDNTRRRRRRVVVVSSEDEKSRDAE